MAEIKAIQWEVSVTVQRKQIIALGLLAEFLADIEGHLKRECPSQVKDINWDEVRGFFHEARRLKLLDGEFYKHITDFQVTH